jgi:hypothetical protein
VEGGVIVSSAPDDRLFTVNGYGDDFFTGVCSDGRQVVMGLLCPEVVAYFFDAEGRLLGDERRPWDHPAPRMGGNGPYRIYDDVFQGMLAVQIAEWQTALDCSSGPIRVRQFFDRRHPVGITLLPSHMQPTDDEWRDMSRDERRELEHDRAEWLANGEFVWLWAKDYWMAADGEVTST